MVGGCALALQSLVPAMRSPAKHDDGFGLGLRSAGRPGRFMLGQNGWQQLDSPARDGPGAGRARVALLAPGGQRGGHHTASPPSRPAPVVSGGQRRASGAAAAATPAGGAAAKGQTGLQQPLPPRPPADIAAAPPRGAAVTPSPLGGAAGRTAEGPFSLQPKGGSRAGGNGCNCKQSKCLKLYCVCFAKGGVCGPQCQCATCHNKDAHSEEVCAEALERLGTLYNANRLLLTRHPTCMAQVLAARANCKKRAATLTKNGDAPGCNCKQSRCQKKYCECFAVRPAGRAVPACGPKLTHFPHMSQAGRQCSPSCKCLNCENCSAPRPSAGPGGGAKGPSHVAAPVASKAAHKKAATLPPGALKALELPWVHNAAVPQAAHVPQPRARPSKRARKAADARGGASGAPFELPPPPAPHAMLPAHTAAAAYHLLGLSTPPGSRFRGGAGGAAQIDPGLFGSSPLPAGGHDFPTLPMHATPLLMRAGASSAHAHVPLSPSGLTFGMPLDDAVGIAAGPIMPWAGITPMSHGLRLPLNLGDDSVMHPSGGMSHPLRSVARLFGPGSALDLGVGGASLPPLSPNTCAMLMQTPSGLPPNATPAPAAVEAEAHGGAGVEGARPPATRASLSVAFANVATTPADGAPQADGEDGGAGASRKRRWDGSVEGVCAPPSAPQWTLVDASGRRGARKRGTHYVCDGLAGQQGMACAARMLVDEHGVSSFSGDHTCGFTPSVPVTPGGALISGKGTRAGGARAVPATPATQ